MNGIPRPHPAQVPTLTEIVDLQPPGAMAPPPPPHPPPPSPAPAAQDRPPVALDALPVLGDVVISESQLAHRVLSDVQRQVDSMLEFRLKEAMGPLLARHTEAIARDLRDELNKTLKDVVARSVAQELAKLRQR